MVEPRVSYLESTILAAAGQTGVSIRTAGCACLACRALSLRSPSASCTISAGLAPLWPKKGHSRRARSLRRSEWLPEGAHREEDSRRGGNKQNYSTSYSFRPRSSSAKLLELMIVSGCSSPNFFTLPFKRPPVHLLSSLILFSLCAAPPPNFQLSIMYLHVHTQELSFSSPAPL